MLLKDAGAANLFRFWSLCSGCYILPLKGPLNPLNVPLSSSEVLLATGQRSKFVRGCKARPGATLLRVAAGKIANYIAIARACNFFMHVEDYWRVPSLWMVNDAGTQPKMWEAQASYWAETDFQETPPFGKPMLHRS